MIMTSGRRQLTLVNIFDYDITYRLNHYFKDYICFFKVRKYDWITKLG
jgi:hypothetical protein